MLEIRLLTYSLSWVDDVVYYSYRIVSSILWHQSKQRNLYSALLQALYL